jgi:endoglucanase
MKKILAFLLLLCVVLTACYQRYTLPTPTSPAETRIPPLPTPLPESIPTTVASLTLQRGINFGNMLEAPNEGDWGLTVQEAYFDLVKEAGFDFVRLPVRWNAHAAPDYPYTIDPAFFARIDQVIGWAQARDLTIIINLHHYEELATDPWSHKDRLVGLWRQIAEHYKEYPANVLFELCNEPNGELNAALWNAYLAETLAVVRATNPERDVVIGPVWWNAYDWLSTLDVPQDEHLIVTFHYYLPFQFTHQGAEWIGDESQQWLGTEWGSEAEKQELTRHFADVAQWAQRKGVRMLLGEFGVYSKATMSDRVRWTAFVRGQAEAHGFAWAYWEFGSGFGAYDPQARQWRPDLLKALIP